MEFLSVGSLLKEHSSAIIVGVYTDKITVSSITKEGGKTTLIATVAEPQEGDAFLGGVLDIERIVQNCRKALAALPHGEGNGPRDVVFALGGGVGAFLFVQEKNVREEKERKIIAEDVAALIGARTQRNDEEVMSAFAESFLIDGFTVENPVGMHGGEMFIGVARMVCGSELAKGLASVADAAGLSVKGFFDMRYAAAHYAKLFEEGKESAIVLCVFEHETSAILVRNRAVAGAGVARAGYGMLIKALEDVFLVGREEAKKIMYAFAKKELDAHVHERAYKACDAARGALTAEIAHVVARLDPTSLLPGNVWVVPSEDIAQAYELLQSSEWFAPLPMERDAVVRVWSAEERDGFPTPFDYIVAKSL